MPNIFCFCVLIRFPQTVFLGGNDGLKIERISMRNDLRHTEMGHVVEMG